MELSTDTVINYDYELPCEECGILPLPKACNIYMVTATKNDQESVFYVTICKECSKTRVPIMETRATTLKLFAG